MHDQDGLVAFAIALAKRHLERAGEFYPFAVTSCEGGSNEIDVAGDADAPMELLSAALRERARSKQSSCLVACADVAMEPGEASDPATGHRRGCLWLHFESRRGVALDIWQSYAVSPEGAVVLQAETRAHGVLQYFPNRIDHA